jgi:DNA-binding GntR family transcriptional regulator
VLEEGHVVLVTCLRRQDLPGHSAHMELDREFHHAMMRAMGNLLLTAVRIRAAPSLARPVQPDHVSQPHS